LIVKKQMERTRGRAQGGGVLLFLLSKEPGLCGYVAVEHVLLVVYSRFSDLFIIGRYTVLFISKFYGGIITFHTREGKGLFGCHIWVHNIVCLEK